METEDILESLPKRPPRHCPVCGARVAEGAKVCLMCGASLEEEPEAEAEVPAPRISSRSLKVLQIVIMVIVAIVILVGSGILGWKLSQGDVIAPAELPAFTPTMTHTPTITPSPTRTATPTLIPTPLPTPTPLPPQTYTVQSGDTLGEIATEFDITVEELKAYNGLVSDDIGEGQSLLIPPPTPTPGPPPTAEPGVPTASPAPYLLHTVRAGDTLSTIAEQYGVSVVDIRRANNIPEDSETINVDHVLTIPQHTPTPEAQAETFVSGTPTPIMAYSAPEMLYPPDGTTFTGADAVAILQWAAIGILKDKEYYKLEFIVPTAEGKTTVNVYQRATAWRVSEDLLPPADIVDRTCSWRVSVVRLVTESGNPTYKVISQTVKRRTFTWKIAEP
jgi:LysM repeat protein